MQGNILNILIGVVAVASLIMAIICLLKKEKYQFLVTDEKGDIGLHNLSIDGIINPIIDNIKSINDNIKSIESQIDTKISFGDQLQLTDPNGDGVVTAGTNDYVPGCGQGQGASKGCMAIFVYPGGRDKNFATFTANRPTHHKTNREKKLMI